MGVYLGRNAVDIIGGTKNVTGGISLQKKNITPSESEQTITADSGYDGLSSVVVSAIPATYIGSDVTIQKYYTGNTTPSSSFGEDGDLYLKL